MVVTTGNFSRPRRLRGLTNGAQVDYVPFPPPGDQRDDVESMYLTVNVATEDGAIYSVIAPFVVFHPGKNPLRGVGHVDRRKGSRAGDSFDVCVICNNVLVVVRNESGLVIVDRITDTLDLDVGAEWKECP